jgi:hypothetical protein
MNWSEMHKMPLTKNLGNTRKQSDNSETINRQAETPQHETSNIRVIGRERKIPVTRTNYFYGKDTY